MALKVSNKNRKKAAETEFKAKVEAVQAQGFSEDDLKKVLKWIAAGIIGTFLLSFII